jgi:2,4-dienoyl-CoA reductase-like NADH-dependent reductase (Old Yellow Enzyme family)
MSTTPEDAATASSDGNPLPAQAMPAVATARYGALFRPLQIAGVMVPNRIARAPHNAGMPWLDVSDDFLHYHEERAKGGVGLIILGIAGVHPSYTTTIPAHEDRVITGYRKLAARLHPYGTKIFQQLQHPGAALAARGTVPVSASPVPNPRLGAIPPRAMTRSEIAEFVEHYARAAARVQQGGLDGVELHAAHGYLLTQFLSPALNRREDEYGGSLENRTRFAREILQAIRHEVGPDFAVGVRLSNTEEVVGGIDPAEAARIAARLEELVDFVDVSTSSYFRFHRFFSTMDTPLAYEVADSELVTRAVTVPTIVTGRIMTLDDANRIVIDGAADMVSMVRPLIADPYLVTKAREGREAEIRPCIGTNQGCVGRFFTTGRLGCTVNPAAGRESTIPFDPPRAGSPKKVIVVGGGPAGMEAARSAALAGHSVELLELTRTLGGQVAIAARAPHRTDIGAITEWLASELNRLGVTVRLNALADPDLIVGLGPDEVVVATGSTPRGDGFQTNEPRQPVRGVERRHVYTSWQVFGAGGRATIGRAALVHDDTGGYEAISVAEALVAAGAEVTFVHRHETVGAMVDYAPATVYPARERLEAAGVTFIPFGSIAEVTDEDVEIVLSRGPRRLRIPADTVVLVGHNIPNTELADALQDAPFRVHVIGDAAGTRTLDDAIAAGAALARSL